MKSTINVNIELLENSVGKPYYATQNSSGIDITAGIKNNIVLNSMEYKIIPTGLKLIIPDGFEGQIRPRSGLAFKHGITVLNTPGTIDSDYRGELKVLLLNLGKQDFSVLPGMRIAQLIISSVEKAKLVFIDKLDSKTERADKGFGSTGI